MSMYKMADGSGRDSYVRAARVGTYRPPRQMTPPQTWDGMCPKNRPRAMDSAHDHDIISNTQALDVVSPKRFRPLAHFAPAPVDLSPPKVRAPRWVQEARDQRMPLSLTALPPNRFLTTNQETAQRLFKGSPPNPRLRDSGRLAGFSGHIQGGTR
eukprot:Hpha_TRINITY_DN16165_c3_g5::TRINITY_DN16165_c3_g5_i1::g.9280::m.9280